MRKPLTCVTTALECQRIVMLAMLDDDTYPGQ